MSSKAWNKKKIPLRGYGQVPSGSNEVLAGHPGGTACSARAR